MLSNSPFEYLPLGFLTEIVALAEIRRVSSREDNFVQVKLFY